MAMDANTRSWMTGLLGDRVRFDEPMARHTWFQVGGPADAYAAPGSTADLVELVRRAAAEGIPYRVVGDGTNLLVTDAGMEGVVISLRSCLREVAVTDRSGETVWVTAMAGARLQRLCRFAAEHGLEGMNFAVGIPGTVGGALSMNAGTSTGCMADVVDTVTVLFSSGNTAVLERERLRFAYRSFSLPEPRPGSAAAVVLGGGFRLRRGDQDRIQKEVISLLERRRATQPLSEPSGGCFFKNPTSGPSAGELIDRAGLKGSRVGDAMVSAVHANFIVNGGSATAADILHLRDRIREVVLQRFGVALEEEVQIIGR
jgi:UDP-N-acetylmuramate dehydrogenase